MDETEGPEITFVPLGPLFGWFCAGCGAVRMGYADKEESRAGAGRHMMSAHAPSSGWEDGSRMLAVQWWDDGDGAEHAGSGEWGR